MNKMTRNIVGAVALYSAAVGCSSESEPDNMDAVTLTGKNIQGTYWNTDGKLGYDVITRGSNNNIIAFYDANKEITLGGMHSGSIPMGDSMISLTEDLHRILQLIDEQVILDEERAKEN